MNRPTGRILRGVLAGGLLFVGSMTAVAALAIATGLVQPIDAATAPGFHRWILLEVVVGVPLSALSGRLSRTVGESVRAPRILATTILLFGALEALTLLSSGFIPARSLAGILILLAPFLASAAALVGGCGFASLPRVPVGSLTPPGEPSQLASTRGIWRWSIPLILVFIGLSTGLFGIPVVEEFDRQRLVASALAVDLVFVVPLIVYALLVRPGRLPLVSVVPVAILGYGVAIASIPADHEVVVGAIRWAIVPAEILLLSVVAVKARRMFRTSGQGGDFIQRLRETTRSVLGNRIAADILTTEIAVLYYALRVRSNDSPEPPADSRAGFTVHRSVGYAAILAGLGMAILVETVAVHFLVRQASPTAAWILTGLSCYALLWLIGDFRALRSRLTHVAAGSLSYRMGLRWEVDIPLSCINSASRMSAAAISDDTDAFSGVLVGSPNTRIKLHRPVVITGMYGLRKWASVLHLRIDNPDGFLAAIGAVGGAE